MAKLRCLVFLLPVFLFASALYGQSSQPPSPSRGETGVHNPKSTPQTDRKDAAAHQAGSEDSPIFIEQIPTPKTDEEATKEKKKDDENASDKRLNNRLTVALVLSSGLQAVIAIFQFFLFRRQTCFIDKQADLMERQTGIADSTLISTFRPRLLVRSVVLKQDALNTGDCKADWRVRFTVSNIGGSPATIVMMAAGGVIEATTSLPAEPPYDALTVDKPKLTLVPGQHQDFTFPIHADVGSPLWSWHKWPEDNPKSSFYLLGYIRFADEVKMIRSYGFCRRYSPTTKRFLPIEDADYEYAD